MILPQFRRTPFSFDSSSDQEKFDYYLKQYLGTNLNRSKAEAIQKMSSLLVHPNLVLETKLLTDDHPFKKEALIVFDAFESVTNGMYNPDVLEALEGIPLTSLFYGWKELILAILFFYKGLPEATRLHAGRIPAESAPAHLKKLLISLSQTMITDLSKAEYNFFQEIYEADPKLTPAVEQILDSIDTGMEEMHFQALELILGGLPSGYDELGKSLALWSLHQLSLQDFDPDTLNQIIFDRYGKSEGCRLIALGLLDFETETALLFWLQFMIFGLRNQTLPRTDLAAALDLARDFAVCVRELQPKADSLDADFLGSFEALFRQLKAEIEILYPNFPLSETNFQDFLHPIAETRVKPAGIKGQAKQLDLFAS